MPGILATLISALLALLSAIVGAPFVARSIGAFAGQRLWRGARGRRSLIYQRVAAEEETNGRTSGVKADGVEDEWERVEGYTVGTAPNGAVGEPEWDGVVGFFHPFCNAGGGGERVLWAAIHAVQQRWRKAICVVYTGDVGVDKAQMLSRVEARFNIHLHPPTLVFIYLTTRRYVLSSTYPRLTLLGQSLGSMVLAYEALWTLAPDIFVDTMGYAFALALCKFLFPAVPTAAYVHYPTISTDMLDSLRDGGPGLNGGAGRGLKGLLKRRYWELFARLYAWAGGTVDGVMANSSWTQAHLQSLWAGARARRGKTSAIQVVFPPVAVEQLAAQIEVSADSEAGREPSLLYIAQFRPEKNHSMVVRAFAALRRSSPAFAATKLVLLGSVRHSDDAKRVYQLRLLAHELQIKAVVEFVCDGSWPDVLDRLRRCSVGVNGMWNEHFGIGVVEYQAAGLISVVHDSGGPKADIVVEVDGRPTGFHASSAEEFTAAFATALSLSPSETLAMRLRARASARRFTEEAFARRWIAQMQLLMDLRSGASAR